mgnify:CR=1 FL=1
MKPLLRLFRVISSHLVLVCVLTAYMIGQLHSTQAIVGVPASSCLISVDDKGLRLTYLFGTNDPLWQFKTGPNSPGTWPAYFDHSNTVSILPGCLFRNGGHLWTLGLRHTLLIACGVVLILFTHRTRVRGFLRFAALQISTPFRYALRDNNDRTVAGPDLQLARAKAV